jgi:hypothetical protein
MTTHKHTHRHETNLPDDAPPYIPREHHGDEYHSAHRKPPSPALGDYGSAEEMERAERRGDEYERDVYVLGLTIMYPRGLTEAERRGFKHLIDTAIENVRRQYDY